VAAFLATLSAKAAVTPTRAVPWPDPHRYAYTFGIEVIAEFDEPIGDRFRDRRSIEFGVRGDWLQSGFVLIEDEAVAKLDSAFAETGIAAQPWPPPGAASPRAESPAPARAPASDGRHGRPLAGVYLRPARTPTEALLALYRRVGDDPDGELLVIGDEVDRAAVEAELSEEPFVAIRDRVRFVTAEQLTIEISSRFRQTRT
jgi:hypothetical protein